MFVGRVRELKQLREQFGREGRTAILVYGKRRVGKSTLLLEAAKEFPGTVINNMCIRSTLAGNLEALGQSVSDALHLPPVVAGDGAGAQLY